MEEESQEKKSHLVETQKHVQKMIENRQEKIEELKQSIEFNKKHTDKEKTESMKMFSALMRCIERSQADLLKGMEEKHKAAERQAEQFIRELEQEIIELKKKNSEMVQLLQTQDHLMFLQIYPFLHGPLHNNNWNYVKCHSPLSIEPLRRALNQLQVSLNEEIKKLPEIELKIYQQYAVDVTLDPDTANSKLILSYNSKQLQEFLNMAMEKPLKFELKEIQQYVVDVTLDPDTANSKLLLSDDQKQTQLGTTPEEVMQNKQKDSGKAGHTSERKQDKQTVELLRRTLSQLLEILIKDMDKFAEFEDINLPPWPTGDATLLLVLAEDIALPSGSMENNALPPALWRMLPLLSCPNGGATPLPGLAEDVALPFGSVEG
ncbi:hypothetical protein KOW79_006821 [Hemibagrus wyckioides]|uniref:SPRY-associated domain-containing protein n=1 Tax=Hemibagrus wyckioides TaxID=337641 RepID=A0A9D3NYQ9_9TELE|nr:hypothetical protein KOW79_006821 [Hemibagrus wyckioides]